MLDTWKTGQIFQPGGRFNRYATGETSFSISNAPTQRLHSFTNKCLSSCYRLQVLRITSILTRNISSREDRSAYVFILCCQWPDFAVRLPGPSSCDPSFLALPPPVNPSSLLPHSKTYWGQLDYRQPTDGMVSTPIETFTALFAVKSANETYLLHHGGVFQHMAIRNFLASVSFALVDRLSADETQYWIGDLHQAIRRDWSKIRWYDVDLDQIYHFR